MKSYVNHCEDRSLMHYDLFLWHHDERRPDDAAWHHEQYRLAVKESFLDDLPYDDRVREYDQPGDAVDKWRLKAFAGGLEFLHDDEELAQYHHD